MNRGDIPTIDVGTKVLINFDVFLETLTRLSTGEGGNNAQGPGGIMPIPENLPKYRGRRAG